MSSKSTINPQHVIIAPPHNTQDQTTATQQFEKQYPDLVKYTVTPSPDYCNSSSILDEFYESDFTTLVGYHKTKYLRNQSTVEYRAWLKEAIRRVLVNPAIQNGEFLRYKDDNFDEPLVLELASDEEPDCFYVHPCDAGTSQKYWDWEEDYDDDDDGDNDNDDNDNDNCKNTKRKGANGDVYNYITYKPPRHRPFPATAFNIIHRRIGRYSVKWEHIVLYSISTVIQDDFETQCDLFKVLALTSYLNPHTISLHSSSQYLSQMPFFGLVVLWLGVKGGILEPFQGFTQDEFDLPRTLPYDEGFQTLPPSQQLLYRSHFSHEIIQIRARSDEDYYVEVLELFRHFFQETGGVFDLEKANELFFSLFCPSPFTPSGQKMTQDALNLFVYTYDGDLEYLVRLQRIFLKEVYPQEDGQVCCSMFGEPKPTSGTCIDCTHVMMGCALLQVCISMAKVLLDHGGNNSV